MLWSGSSPTNCLCHTGAQVAAAALLERLLERGIADRAVLLNPPKPPPKARGKAARGRGAGQPAGQGGEGEGEGLPSGKNYLEEFPAVSLLMELFK